MNKELNYILLYGNVVKANRKKIIMKFGNGKIKIITESPDICLKDLKEGYTVHIAGRLRQGFIKHYLIADAVSILDKKPHKFPGVDF